MSEDEIKKELSNHGCNDNDRIIIVDAERFDNLCHNYTWHESEQLYYIDGIDNAIYCIEKENYNNFWGIND